VNTPSLPPFEHGGYRIGFGHLSDAAAIARIEAAVFPEPLGLSDLIRVLLRPGTRYVVARRGRQLCAYFGFEVSGPTAHVLSNATHPDHRRRGLARTLLLAGEAVAARAGARWLLGEVRRSNVLQVELLQGLGWRVLDLCPRFFGNGEDAWVVWKLLAPPGR
jgi:ribosomal-protein-alanine N-acetyltransferase